MNYSSDKETTNDDSRVTSANSFFRTFHASPNTPPVDIYVNGKLLIANFKYKQFSNYFAVFPGNYNFKYYLAGQKTKPLLDINLPIPDNFIVNPSIIGLFPNLDIYPVPEPAVSQGFGKPCIRFINLSPTAQSFDITLENGTKIFDAFRYMDISDYACMEPGTYTFQARLAGTNNVVATLQNVQLTSSKYYGIYAVGVLGTTQPLQLLVTQEGR
jgi:hypothetical protein